MLPLTFPAFGSPFKVGAPGRWRGWLEVNRKRTQYEKTCRCQYVHPHYFSGCGYSWAISS